MYLISMYLIKKRTLIKIFFLKHNCHLRFENELDRNENLFTRKIARKIIFKKLKQYLM